MNALRIAGWISVAAMLGCAGKSSGPETARVYGVVTLDGQPLEDATVMFVPSNGRPATGITDSTGKYELMYTNSRRGATLGEHAVRVSTCRDVEDAEGHTRTFPEKVPAKYNHRSDLKKTVTAGLNEINLELDSQGEIIQSN